MYEGEESRILLILGKKVISDRSIRLRARDARYEDNVICDVKEVLEEIQIGDLRWFTKSVCINTPNWRKLEIQKVVWEQTIPTVPNSLSKSLKKDPNIPN